MTDFSGDQNMNAGYQYVPGEQPTALNKSLQSLLVHLLGSVHLTLLIVRSYLKLNFRSIAASCLRARRLARLRWTPLRLLGSARPFFSALRNISPKDDNVGILKPTV